MISFSKCWHVTHILIHCTNCMFTSMALILETQIKPMLPQIKHVFSRMFLTKKTSLQHIWTTKPTTTIFSQFWKHLKLFTPWEVFLPNWCGISSSAQTDHNLSGTSQPKGDLSFVSTYIYIYLKIHILVGGWTNPFEKYDRQFGSFHQRSGWK